MLHPVGDLSPAVYWRRRAMLLAALLLAVLSVYVVFFRHGGSQPPKANGAFSSPGSTHPSTTDPAPSTTSAAQTSAASSKPAPKACLASQLTVAAATDATSYPVGAKPQVELVVTNTGPAPCVQDLSDSQIELRVYNGSARVWGSHDCAVAPGTAPSMLPVGNSIRRAVEWSGPSSRPGCAGVRTRVAAGTYTLYAYLSGHQGKPSTFSMAG